MEHVIVIIHIILAVSIIGLVLIQKGSGGGLGIGGGAGGLASPRGAANILTKATTWAAILFFGTSLTLAILAGHSNSSSVIDELEAVDNATPALVIEDGALEVAPQVPTDTKEPIEVPVTP